MDKIWDRNPSKSEVIGRCGGDEKKRMATQNRQKVERYKNNTVGLIVENYLYTKIYKLNQFD